MHFSLHLIRKVIDYALHKIHPTFTACVSGLGRGSGVAANYLRMRSCWHFPLPHPQPKQNCESQEQCARGDIGIACGWLIYGPFVRSITWVMREALSGRHLSWIANAVGKAAAFAPDAASHRPSSECNTMERH